MESVVGVVLHSVAVVPVVITRGTRKPVLLGRAELARVSVEEIKGRRRRLKSRLEQCAHEGFASEGE